MEDLVRPRKAGLARDAGLHRRSGRPSVLAEYDPLGLVLVADGKLAPEAECAAKTVESVIPSLADLCRPLGSRYSLLTAG